MDIFQIFKENIFLIIDFRKELSRINELNSSYYNVRFFWQCKDIFSAVTCLKLLYIQYIYYQFLEFPNIQLNRRIKY